MYKQFFLLPSMLPFIKHGEGNDPAKVSANALALLGRYGHTADDLATLADADEAKLGELFTTRFTGIETDVVARKSKGITDAARVSAFKDAYYNAEQRARTIATEFGIEIKDEEIAALPEKERLEGLIKLALERKKAVSPDTPEETKAVLARLEAERKAATEAQKAAKEWQKKYEELNTSLPTLEEKISLRYFAEQNWQQIALKKETLDMLSITDESVLLSIVKGKMAENGHKFMAEKGSNGRMTLLVTDSEGNPIGVPNGAGNFTPEDYILDVYKPLVKKSNGKTEEQHQAFPDFETNKPLEGNAKKAWEAMKKQAETGKN